MNVTDLSDWTAGARTQRGGVARCHGDANGRIEWDVKDCMQSRQDYIIAVKERKDMMSSNEDSPVGGYKREVLRNCRERHFCG